MTSAGVQPVDVSISSILPGSVVVSSMVHFYPAATGDAVTFAAMLTSDPGSVLAALGDNGSVAVFGLVVGTAFVTFSPTSPPTALPTAAPTSAPSTTPSPAAEVVQPPTTSPTPAEGIPTHLHASSQCRILSNNVHERSPMQVNVPSIREN